MAASATRFCFYALIIGCVVASRLQAQEEPGSELSEPVIGLPSLTEPAAAGSVLGSVLDATTAEPIPGVEVTLTLAGADGAAPAEETAITDAEGQYDFGGVPEGTHSLRFAKPGYRAARWHEFPVVPDQMNPGDFALQPETAEPSGDGIEEIVVIGKLKAPEASRPDADEFINTMDMAEIGKFAASDIGEAIKRIAGINVVEGQFAIIRGLEDRYSSTLYNSAPVPSPDPDTQSVQLDLFPSEVATNLVVAKTFAANLPSNSSGGSINIISQDYPESTFEFKFSGGSGYNTAAADSYIEYVEGSPIGQPGDDITEGDTSLTLAGHTLFAEREIRVKAAATYEVDFGSRIGERETREPRRSATFPAVSGDLSLGDLSLSGGHFDFTESARVEQVTAFLDLAFDLDTEANHRVNFSAFYTQRDEESAQIRENGYLPNFDYDVLAAKRAVGDSINPNQDFDGFASFSAWIARSIRETDSDSISRGPVWFSSFAEGRSFQRDRDLQVYQFNGDHAFDALPGFTLTWAANHAKTSQDDDFFATRFFFEPADLAQPTPTTFPVSAHTLGTGDYAANEDIFFSANRVREDQSFGRIDFAYERDLAGWLAASVESGFWYERSTRDVASQYLESPTVSGSSQFALTGSTPVGLGYAIDDGLDQSAQSFSGIRDSSNDSDREIWAWSLSAKLTFVEDVDVIAGVRREEISIVSENDAFTGTTSFDGSPAIYPTKYLMFDRLDNPARAEVSSRPPPGTTFNDQILGIDVDVDPSTGFVDLVDRAAIEAFINGNIEEIEWLPSAGITYRPIDGLNVRAAYSQTVARPSFREVGFYVSVEEGTDDLVVGNPQLELSNVESWDARVEYLWGDFGDLAAFSAFTKKIQNPIESIIIRDPTDFEASTLFRTFMNNPDTASLWGIELEARKAIDFVGVDLLQYLSIAANFTYIDAEVDRSEIELQRSTRFFGINVPGDEEPFSGLEKTRRLFSQPEWIVNADLTFDHPEWGTKLTLAVFGISDVLDAAGSASLNANNEVVAFTLDRYVDSYFQLDLVGSQTLSFEQIPGEFTFKVSAKNLTDSTRRLIYDPAQTSHTIAERSFKIGVDLAVSFSYEWAF